MFFWVWYILSKTLNIISYIIFHQLWCMRGLDTLVFMRFSFLLVGFRFQYIQLKVLSHYWRTDFRECQSLLDPFWHHYSLGYFFSLFDCKRTWDLIRTKASLPNFFSSPILGFGWNPTGMILTSGDLVNLLALPKNPLEHYFSLVFGVWRNTQNEPTSYGFFWRIGLIGYL